MPITTLTVRNTTQSAGSAGAILLEGEAVRSEPQASDERRKGDAVPLRVQDVAWRIRSTLKATKPAIEIVDRAT